MRTRQTQRTAQRAGSDAEQRVDTAFALLGHEACLTPHHPETKFLDGQWIRVKAGPCDRSGWMRLPPYGPHAIPLMLDVKHVTLSERLYRHDPKAAHQLGQMVDFSRGGLAGLLILHDTANEPGGRWLFHRIASAAHMALALAGFALRPTVRRSVTHDQPPSGLVALDVPWFGTPDPTEFREFLFRCTGS